MSAREFLWIVKESALGTAMASPVAGTDSIYIRLSDSNSFTMLAEPVVEEIPYGGGFAVTAEEVSDHYTVKGTLKTKLYPSQQLLLIGWAIVRIDAGQTSPWTTTEPAGDLASCTVYHAVRNSDGTYRRTKYTGVKVDKLAVAASRQANAAMATFTLTGCRSYPNAMDSTAAPDATEFPAPAESDYPTGPYTFTHTAGHFSVGTARTQYLDVSLNVDNTLDARFFETSFLTAIPALGRSTTLDATLILKATPDDRATYQSRAAQAVSLGFNNGTKSVTFNLNGRSRIAKLPFELPLNQQYTTKMSLVNRWDPTANAGVGGDVDVSFT